MAGNTIYMQPGSNYIDVHDNEVVNLNVDKGTVQVQDNETSRRQDDEVMERATVLTENKEFMRILQKAVDAGFCQQDGWQYKWINRGDSALFASIASHKFHLSKRHDRDGDLAISWKPFEALFDEKNLRSVFNDWQNGKYSHENEKTIEKLLR